MAGKIVSSGRWMCTPSLPPERGKLYLRVNSFTTDTPGWWELPEFPGAPNVGMVDIQGFAGPSVIVLDTNNQLWRIGLPGPGGDWVQDIPQPTFTMAHFLGAGFGDDNQTWYLAATDPEANGYIIGNPLGGGGWVPVPGLKTP